MLAQYESESQSYFRKVHKMIDLFEVIIKLHTSLILSEYFRIKNVSDRMKVLLAYGLKTPSLGTWILFGREAMVELLIPEQISVELVEAWSKANPPDALNKYYKRGSAAYHLDIERVNNDRKERAKLVKFFLSHLEDIDCPKVVVKGFIPYFYSYERLLNRHKGLPKGNVINFRNAYAHGGTPDEDECRKDVEAYAPILELFLKAKWLNTSSDTPNGYVLDLTNQHVYLNIGGEKIGCFPFIYSLEPSGDEQGIVPFYFLNDMKNYSLRKEEIGMLNYPSAHLLRKVYQNGDFRKVLDIPSWRQKTIKSENHLLIESLSASFVGRQRELETINRFVEADGQQYLLTLGAPGIGKSALLAKAVLAYQDKYIVLSYFIRRQTVGSIPHQLLSELHRQLDMQCETNLDSGREIEEMRQKLLDKITRVQNNTNKKIIIVIDGLDEGTEIGASIHELLFVESLKGLKILYGSRSIAETEVLFRKLPVDSKLKLTLQGIKLIDVQALLMQVMNKYDVFKHSGGVESIWQASQGNPLYLKLLLRDLEYGVRRIDDLKSLPTNLDSFYEEIIDRLCKEDENDDVFMSLLFFAAIKERVEPLMLSEVFAYTVDKRRKLLKVIDEVLEEDKGYLYLFHESFRDYLKATYQGDFLKIHWHIGEFCKGWPSLQDKLYLPRDIKAYPAKYYGDHLVALSDSKGMENLLFGPDSPAFRNYQLTTTGTRKATYNLVKMAFELFDHNDLKEMKLPVTGLLLRVNGSLVADRDKRFSQMFNGDYETLLKLYEDLVIEEPEIRGGHYVTLLVCILCSTQLSSEERHLLLKIVLEDEAVHLVYPPSDLPFEILAFVMYECQSFGRVGYIITQKVFADARMDYEAYDLFYDWFGELISHLIGTYGAVDLAISLIRELDHKQNGARFNCYCIIGEYLLAIGRLQDYETILKLLDEDLSRWIKSHFSFDLFFARVGLFIDLAYKHPLGQPCLEGFANLLSSEIKQWTLPLSRKDYRLMSSLLSAFNAVDQDNSFKQLVLELDQVLSGSDESINNQVTIINKKEKETNNKSLMKDLMSRYMQLETLNLENLRARLHVLHEEGGNAFKIRDVLRESLKNLFEQGEASLGIALYLTLIERDDDYTGEDIANSYLLNAWTPAISERIEALREQGYKNAGSLNDDGVSYFANRVSRRADELIMRHLFSEKNYSGAVEYAAKHACYDEDRVVHDDFYRLVDESLSIQEREIKKLDQFFDLAKESGIEEFIDFVAHHMVAYFLQQEDYKKVYDYCTKDPAFKNYPLKPLAGLIFKHVGYQEGLKGLLENDDTARDQGNSQKIDSISRADIEAFNQSIEGAEQKIYVFETEEVLIESLQKTLEEYYSDSPLQSQIVTHYINKEYSDFQSALNQLHEANRCDIVCELLDLMMVRDEVRLIVRESTNILTDPTDRYQLDGPLLEAVLSLDKADKLRSWLVDICKAHTSEPLKKAFVNEVLKNIHVYGPLIPVVLDVFRNYSLNDPYTLKKLMRLDILCQLSEAIPSRTFDADYYQSYQLDDIFTIERGNLLSSVDTWIGAIDDDDDREDIMAIIDAYKKGHLKEERALKQLKRIIDDYDI